MALGSIIGGAMKAIGSIGGGIAARKAAREVNKRLKQQLEDNQDWYDRRYNEDATQFADAQRLLTMTEESIRNRNRQAAGAAAVMGGTNESVAAAKAANNAALTDTVAQIAANAANRQSKSLIQQRRKLFKIHFLHCNAYVRRYFRYLENLLYNRQNGYAP